ncbi:MAG: DUF2950 family protein [Rhodobacteraceae bacterium]|nr:DUF2950 family protein [Paracoccaceae bacterium]
MMMRSGVRTEFAAVLAAMVGLTGPATAGEAPQVYPTAQDALEAMVAALTASDPSSAVLEVFGTEAADFLSTGDPLRDQLNRLELLAIHAEGFRFQPDGADGLIVLLGAEGWPFPIPLSRSADGWAFDVEAGRDEVHHRRVGVNELDVIDFLRAYVDIQAAYRLVDHDGDGVMEFAASFLSSSDGRDGLVWADPDSPLGVRIARASLDGYSDGQQDVAPEPFGGYYYRILTGQSDNAPGGEIDYIMGGNMIAGHAVIAVPSDYGTTGFHSFMVAENGVVLEADLGEDSLEKVFAMTRYDPGPDWSAVD